MRLFLFDEFFLVKTMEQERLIELETKLAYQEDTIQQLNSVVCRQQDQIDLLFKKFDLLVSRTEEISDKLPDEFDENERPPHY